MKTILERPAMVAVLFLMYLLIGNGLFAGSLGAGMVITSIKLTCLPLLVLVCAHSLRLRVPHRYTVGEPRLARSAYRAQLVAASGKGAPKMPAPPPGRNERGSSPIIVDPETIRAVLKKRRMHRISC